MKTTITLLMACLTVTVALAQHPENGSFENWNNTVLYEDPDDWITSNFWAWQTGMQVVTKSTDSHGGIYACHLQGTVSADGDSIAGLVMNSGSIEGDDTLMFDGGFSMTAMPDSLVGWFKFDLAMGDTALVAALFQNNGVPTSSNMFTLTGTQNGWTRLAWALEAGATPTEAVVAVTSSNPDFSNPNSWVMVDDLEFVGSPDVIPNGDFEDWHTIEYEDPVKWGSANLYSALTMGTPSVTQSSDAHDGTSSVRVETVEVEFEQDEPASHMGFLVNSRIQEGDFGSGQPYSDRPLELTGWYKYTANGTDTAFAAIEFNRWNSTFGFSESVYEKGTYLMPAANWTQFSIDLSDFDTTQTIDSVLIYFASSTLMFVDSPAAPLGSVLLLDELTLTGACDFTNVFDLFVYTDTTICDTTSLMLDAGSALSQSFVWNTGETTQMIEADTEGPYTVEVTYVGGCTFTDSIYVNVVVCTFVDEIAADEVLRLYPNPASTQLLVEVAATAYGTLQVVDALGKVVDVQRVQGANLRMDVSDLTPGLYFLRLQTEQGTQVRKLLVE